MRCSLLAQILEMLSYSKIEHVHSDWFVYNDTDINAKDGQGTCLPLCAYATWIHNSGEGSLGPWPPLF